PQPLQNLVPGGFAWPQFEQNLGPGAASGAPHSAQNFPVATFLPHLPHATSGAAPGMPGAEAGACCGCDGCGCMAFWNCDAIAMPTPRPAPASRPPPSPPPPFFLPSPAFIIALAAAICW